MKPVSLQNLAARLLQHPAAPYHEHAVRAEAEQFCAEEGLEFERDGFGNLFVRVWGRSNSRPLALSAHMDHPGFEVGAKLSARRWLATFRGGVPDAYFRPGLRVQLLPGGVGASLGRRVRGSQRTFELHADVDSESVPRFAVWDLKYCSVRQGRIYARACDDVIGVVAVLGTLAELKKKRANIRVLGLLSRAEEVGFHGALAAADSSRRAARKSGWAKVPHDALVVSLETSREMPGVKIGQGVIVRVGDKASIFDSDASRFLAEIAADLDAKNKGFRFQRALMSGGTCEATAFQEFGFRSAAVCVALGNYHNCGKHNRIRAEYVSVADVCGMIDLLVSASVRMHVYDQLVGKLPERLNKLLEQARTNLRRNP